MMKKILLLFCLVFGLSFVPTAQAAMISEKQEIEMGERAGKALEAQYGLYHRTSMLLLVPAASSMSIRALWIP